MIQTEISNIDLEENKIQKNTDKKVDKKEDFKDA